MQTNISIFNQSEIVQPDAFCEHTVQQDATAAGAPPLTPIGSLHRSSGPVAGFMGPPKRWVGRSREGSGSEGIGREREERGRREGKGREGS